MKRSTDPSKSLFSTTAPYIHTTSTSDTRHSSPADHITSHLAQYPLHAPTSLVCDTMSSAASGHRFLTDAQRLRRRERDRNNKASINERRRKTHSQNAPSHNDHQRSYRRKRRASVLSANRSRFDDILRDQQDISRLHSVISQRRQALQAVREDMGVTVKNADPCRHCGAKLFAKESKGICCKNGKYVLPRLPSLPPALNDLYTSADRSAQKFRKESRAYNCRCNFASLNVEDGELKKMFGDHLLSVQGR